MSAVGSAQPLALKREPKAAAGGGPDGPRRRRLFLPRGPGVSRAPTCQPSLPDVFPQQIPGSGRGIPQLLTDGPPELRPEGFPFAGHFRSVLITTSGLATATPAWPAAQTPGDSRRPARDARWGPGTRRGRDMGPPPSRAGAARRARAGMRRRPGSRARLTSALRLLLYSFPTFPPSFPSAGRSAAPLPSPPSPALPDCLAPHSFPQRAFPPFLPPSPKPDSLAPMAPTHGVSTPFSVSLADQGLHHIPIS